MGSKQWFGEKMPVLAMISLQFVYASMALATKASLDKGFRPIIFLVYRQTASSVLLAPLSIFITLRRKPDEKSMGMKGFFLVSMAALIGVTMSANFYYEGLKLASATIASAMSNLVPAETFLIAAAVGLEKVKLGNIRSMAKVVGTIICVCGAIIMVLLKGQKLMNTELKRIIIVNSFLQESGDNKWLLGCFFLIASSTCWSAWLIIQMPICRNHLDPLLLSTWMSVISAFQTAALALFIEPDWRLWRPDSAFSILLCFYTGFCCAVSYFVQSWCIAIRGPLFSALFAPLCTVITTISASFLLHEQLYIGSLGGAAAIVAGLYVVLWGKTKDTYCGNEEHSHQQPAENHVKIRVSEEERHRQISENNLEEPLICSSDEGR